MAQFQEILDKANGKPQVQITCLRSKIFCGNGFTFGPFIAHILAVSRCRKKQSGSVVDLKG
jgi:hypothetical protein